MTETTRFLAEQWAQGIGPAIGAMTGQTSQALVLDRDTPRQVPESALIWHQELSAAEGAAIWVWLPESVWRGVGRQVLESAGIADDGGEAGAADARSTFLEVLQQSLAPIGIWLGGRFGREIDLKNGREAAPIPEGLQWQSVSIRSEHGELGCGWLAASLELLEAFPAEAAPEAREPPPLSSAACSPGKPSRTLDLLMEVELPVGVSFGRAQMRLKDAIKLTTGSIVELNRSVSEPVEIIVNNCVIARGEVVVVEGNYGVRIKQIISRNERLRTLF